MLAKLPDQTDPVEVGRIELADFVNPSGLKPIGDNLFVPSERSGDALLRKPGEDGSGTLAQGFLEGSNVKLTEEFINLVIAQRAYEANAKADPGGRRDAQHHQQSAQVIAMRHAAAALFLLCTLVLAGPCRAQEATVTLKERAEVATARFRLGDIAEVVSSDRRLASQLSEVPIGKTPRIGYSQSVRREDLADLLARRDPSSRAALRWAGPAAVSVLARGQQVDAASLVDAAAQMLYGSIVEGHTYDSVRISPVGKLDTLMLPSGVVHAVPQMATGGGVAKRMCVWMHVSVDGQPYRTIPLWFAVDANRPVAVANADMPAGETLLPGKFSTRIMDVTLFKSDPVLPESIAPTLRLRQPLARGAPLLGAHVDARPPVVRHQSVEVQVVAGAIRIETTGIALTDGRLGEVVRVRNPASGEPPFSARVVAEGVVLVHAR